MPEITMPWGLGRATEQLVRVLPPYTRTEFDPVSQLTHFYDACGQRVDMSGNSTGKAYLTITMSRPHDSSQNAPQGGDDTRNDEDND
ncbi:putative ATP-grasp-modified RiPP [Streptosporangium saharense]|uniref:putative ATP-grasp-modified RiPP n=1 Tax=Streptosporangium saharense TaxID=1706840 RepID=UPI0036BB8904